MQDYGSKTPPKNAPHKHGGPRRLRFSDKTRAEARKLKRVLERAKRARDEQVAAYKADARDSKQDIKEDGDRIDRDRKSEEEAHHAVQKYKSTHKKPPPRYHVLDLDKVEEHLRQRAHAGEDHKDAKVLANMVAESKK